MTSPILHPGLRAAVRERDRDKRRSRVVEPNVLPRVRALEERRPLNACRFEVLAELLCKVTLIDAPAGLIDEYRITGVQGCAGLALSKHEPHIERADDAGIERPCPRVRCLVFIQNEDATGEIHVSAVEPDRFARARPLPV
ncbi:MAG: hypothetical protein L6Q76_05880 [Polyangiaceae bacterium]|nr:hypothetical protein [Polyangiaceae bacterium]